MRKRRSKFFKLFVFIVILTTIFVGVMFFFNTNVNPVIISMSEAKVRALSTRSVSLAISQELRVDMEYSDLIRVKTGDHGQITMLQANTLKINALARAVAQRAQDNIDEVGAQGIGIPIGSLSGIPLFAGRGPAVSIRFIPIGSVVSRFRSVLKAAGINQTVHQIYLTVEATVHIVLPGANDREVKTFTEVLIAESMLIGTIPNTYLSSDKLDEMLNFVPN